MKTTWIFTEEKRPCGEKETIRPLTLGYERLQEYKSNILVQRVVTHPWFIILWEPLTTKVPGPHLTQPYCCYIRTVIFYVRGYIIRPFSSPWKLGIKWKVTKPGQHFEEWSRVETLFRHDDLVEFEKEVFEIGGGRIIWFNKQWWCRYSARRKKP